MNDWDLVRRYLSEGSEDAFRELVHSHVNLVFSAALRVCHGDRTLAEEAVQKTFCTLATKLPALNQNVVIAGWLYRTAVHVARDLQRAERRRTYYEKHALPMNDPAISPEIAERFPAALDAALSAISERDRLPILLRFFQRKSMREVGEFLGISEDAAKMRVSRSLDRLRARLASAGMTLPVGVCAVLLNAANAEAAPGLAASAAQAALHAASLPGSVTLIGRMLFMATGKKLAGLALLLLLGTTISVYESRRAGSAARLKRSRRGLERTNSAAATAGGAGASGLRGPSVADDAAFNLRQVLHDPPESRRLPLERVDQALTAFAGRETDAVAILLEEMNKPRRERSFDAFVLAAHGLQILGTNAAVAVPDLLALLRSGDLAILNDDLPRLLQALSPDGGVVPELIEALKIPHLPGSYQIVRTIDQMIAANPLLEEALRPALQALLHDSELDARRLAACVLAGLPTIKDPEALAVLVEALNLEKVRDPKAYEPLYIPSQSTTVIRDGERMADDIWRAQAIQSLKQFGPAAQDALPALREIAQRVAPTNEYKLRDQALLAINAIAGDDAGSEAAVQAERERKFQGLAERAKSGTATFVELVEGLKDYRSVWFAAEQLSRSPDWSRKATGPLQAALDEFGDYNSAQALKQVDPDLLVQRLRNGNFKGLDEVASALGELGPGVAYATPYLERAFAEMKSGDPGVHAVAEALQQINPGYPKQLFTSDDLHEPLTALLQEIYRAGKIRSPVYDSYIRDMQDCNGVPRPQLLRFIKTVESDPTLSAVFMGKLFEKNPSLAAELRSSPGRKDLER